MLPLLCVNYGIGFIYFICTKDCKHVIILPYSYKFFVLEPLRLKTVPAKIHVMYFDKIGVKVEKISIFWANVWDKSAQNLGKGKSRKKIQEKIYMNKVVIDVQCSLPFHICLTFFWPFIII